MKIRYRLTLWFFAILLFSLLAFSLGVYLVMAQLLYHSMDKNLRIVADAIERSYNPQSKGFDWLGRREQRSNPFLEYYLVLYDTSGKPLFRSPMAEAVSLNIPLSLHRTQEEKNLEISVKRSNPLLRPDEGGDVNFRALNRKIYFGNRQIGWVTVALPYEPIEDAMGNLVTAIFLGIFGTVFLVGAASYWLMRKTLSPVDIITRRARQISQNSLRLRIENVQPGDELGNLAETLNDLLERLERAFNSQKQFLADVAHELKTPLSVLRSHWEVEIGKPDTPQDLREKLTHDIETISRLTHVLDNLLLLAQTENLQENFEFAQLRLDRLLNDLSADVRILTDRKNQTLRVAPLPEVTVWGDSRRLYQLFFNLFENAQKYSPPGAVISLRVEQRDGEVFIEISDTGPGIPAGDLPHIFRRFYRVRGGRSSPHPGSGLGLAIAKLIAEVHGGDIQAESREGKGSLFRVRLPVLNRS